MLHRTAAALLLSLGASSARGHFMCGNNDTQTAPELPTISLSEAYVKADDSVPVDVYFHIISTQAEKHLITDAHVNAQFNVLHSTYLRHGFNFTLVDVSRTVDNELGYNFEPIEDDTSDAEWMKPLRRGGYDALNLYFFPSMDMGGICRFPKTVKNGSDDFYVDGCIVNARTMPGLYSGLWEDTAPHKGTVAIHETGHWFGLGHTFSNGCREVEGRIADLPAQSGYDEYFECPRGRDSCPDMPGLDPIHNFMGYARDSCLTEFTKGQEERMHQMFFAYRRPLVAS